MLTAPEENLPLGTVSLDHKADLLQVGIFFALNFLPWEFLSIKKLEIQKTKNTQYTTFITDKLFFRFPTFLLTKIPREEN